MKLHRLVSLLLVLATAAGGLIAQDSLKDYDVSLFGATSGKSPTAIIKEQNNEQILLACRWPKTRAELKDAKIPFSSDQLAQLKGWGLLRENGGRLRTAVPILESETVGALRQEMLTSATEFARRADADIRDYVRLLDERGNRRSAFTLLFSYVLDDLVWDVFVSRRILEVKYAPQPTPAWRGLVWAVFPPRDFACGTNTLSDQGVQFKMNWSQAVIKKMLPFISRFDLQKRMLQDYLSGGKIADTEAREVFGPFRILGEDGKFLAPIIRTETEEGLSRSSRRLAESVAEFVQTTWSLESIAEALGVDSTDSALIIAYHEFMWELLEHLDQNGVVRMPVAFTDPQAATPADIGDLFFIVDRR